MIRCPQTGQAVSTQIETDAATFGLLPQVETKTHCPHCGGDHVWTRRDAWLENLAPAKAKRSPRPVSSLP
jgi:hypothetical protein